MGSVTMMFNELLVAGRAYPIRAIVTPALRSGVEGLLRVR